MSYEYLMGMRLATPDSSISLNQEPFSSAIFPPLKSIICVRNWFPILKTSV